MMIKRNVNLNKWYIVGIDLLLVLLNVTHNWCQPMTALYS